MKNIGSRAAVFHNNAKQTAGGLRKKDLHKNKRGRIVSLKKSKTAKKWNPLKMLGLLSKTGEAFGARTIGRARKTSGRVMNLIADKKFKASRKKSRRKYRGGYSNYPSAIPNFSNTGTSNPQMRALQAGAGRKCGMRSAKMLGGGLPPLQMTSLNAANSASMVSGNGGINNPLSRALNAGA